MSKALSDEYIKEHFIDGDHEHNATIYLEAYNKEWQQWFNLEKARIISILKDKALMVEHIGSTSVPGLCAKPIIDILLVVKDSADESGYVPDLQKAGYTLRIYEPEFEHHHMFKGIDRDINLHVFSKGSKEIDKYLLFRNYLRNNQDALAMYAAEKRKLAKRKWKYVQNYADAKSEVVQLILDRAMHAK